MRHFKLFFLFSLFVVDADDYPNIYSKIDYSCEATGFARAAIPIIAKE